MALPSTTAGPSRVVNISTVSIGYSTYASSVFRDQQTLPHHASVNLVYDRKPRVDVTPKKTEQNLMVHIGKSEAKVTYKTLRLSCWSSLQRRTKHRAACLRRQNYLYIAMQLCRKRCKVRPKLPCFIVIRNCIDPLRSFYWSTNCWLFDYKY